MLNDSFTLISNRANGHLNVAYVVVQSNQCNNNVTAIKEKMEEIEQFVKDTTHELNTPITALMMSTSRLKSKKTYDEEINKNISISTKQLIDSYEDVGTTVTLSFD